MTQIQCIVFKLYSWTDTCRGGEGGGGGVAGSEGTNYQLLHNQSTFIRILFSRKYRRDGNITVLIPIGKLLYLAFSCFVL